MPDLKTGCSRWVTISAYSSGCWRFPFSTFCPRPHPRPFIGPSPTSALRLWDETQTSLPPSDDASVPERFGGQRRRRSYLSAQRSSASFHTQGVQVTAAV